MEISATSIDVFNVRLLALAPYTVRKNSKGHLEIRRSWFFTVYTIVLNLIMVFLTYRGLLFDANSEIPIRASFRMKSATSKVVTALDVSVVVLATLAGVCCGLFGLKATQELNTRLRTVDTTLIAYSNIKRDRWRSLAMAATALVVISMLLGLDVWTWIRLAKSMKINKHDTELNVQWYIPFYTLYFILTGLHIQFANTAFGLGRRYVRLNLLLASSFLGEYKPTSKMFNLNSVKTISVSPATFHTSVNKLNTETLPSDSTAKNKCLLIKTLAVNHDSLSKCVLRISSAYGIAVLFILVSCLLHLVATAYFLFLELLSNKDNGYLWVQILWIFFHSLRLLMVVEPCHLVSLESRKTIYIICDIERKSYEPVLNEEVKKFWQQLLVANTEFSASGLCRVNRTILTSFASAIATYLVILIQFQKTNG